MTYFFTQNIPFTLCFDSHWCWWHLFLNFSSLFVKLLSVFSCSHWRWESLVGLVTSLFFLFLVWSSFSTLCANFASLSRLHLINNFHWTFLFSLHTFLHGHKFLQRWNILLLRIFTRWGTAFCSIYFVWKKQ